MGIDWTNKWRPLPDSVTIKNSDIDGLGLFAKTNIASGTNLGMMRILVGSEWIRTALGSFSNHVNDNPACMTYSDVNKEGYSCYYLKVIKDLIEGDELTLSYNMPEYNKGKENVLE